jgi:hypothetical protein
VFIFVCSFTIVLVQPDVQNTVISEIDHVSSVTVTFTFPELALLIDTKLLHVGISVMNRQFGNWIDTN